MLTSAIVILSIRFRLGPLYCTGRAEVPRAGAGSCAQLWVASGAVATGYHMVPGYHNIFTILRKLS